MKKIALLCAGALSLVALVVIVARAQKSQPGMAGMQMDDGGAMDSMDAMGSMEAADMDPHMKMTALRPPNQQDRQRADELVRTLRAALQPYMDYHVAEKEGFQVFLPNFVLPQYHFTNYAYGLAAAFRFQPAKPTSLLYRKTANGYELLGAMYTARRNASEETLNERVPLSVARWHAHINICLPPKSEYPTTDWKKFGFEGSISTEQACKAAGGTFYPQIFGWMVHVYPFENSPEKIWSHEPPPPKASAER